MASFDTELSRDGPGLLLKAIRSGEDAQVEAVIGVITAAAPDIVLVQGIDWDAGGRTLAAFADRLAGAGLGYPHRYAPRPNSGLRTGLDMDGDGRRGGWADAQGFGRFTGQGGMALLSRYPIRSAGARDFSSLLWADLPGADLPTVDGAPFPSAAAQVVQRLSDTAHWDVPVEVPGGVLHLLAFAAAPPVFDGPEDRNGRRNADEIRFWRLYLDGRIAPDPPGGRFVILGNANLDPADGEGRHGAIRALLADPRITDPRPRAAGGGAATALQGGVNATQAGDPSLDTVDWADDGPGNLRVDYVLPSADLTVAGAGVLWPEPGAPLAGTVADASRHRLIWVDLVLEGG